MSLEVHVSMDNRHCGDLRSEVHLLINGFQTYILAVFLVDGGEGGLCRRQDDRVGTRKFTNIAIGVWEP